MNLGKLLDIPKLLAELFEMIKTPTAATTTPMATFNNATGKEMQDATKLCSCLFVSQLDDYMTWFRVGATLKKLGAPLELWENLSKRRKKYKPGECSKTWATFKAFSYNMNILVRFAKEGNIEQYDQLHPKLNATNNDVFDDGVEHPSVEINTPFLTTKKIGGEATRPDQLVLKGIVDESLSNEAKKSLSLRSRCGSGKTTFMQRLIQQHDTKRALFITHRQTLARGIMKSFRHLVFKELLG